MNVRTFDDQNQSSQKLLRGDHDHGSVPDEVRELREFHRRPRDRGGDGCQQV